MGCMGTMGIVCVLSSMPTTCVREGERGGGGRLGKSNPPIIED